MCRWQDSTLLTWRLAHCVLGSQIKAASLVLLARGPQLHPAAQQNACIRRLRGVLQAQQDKFLAIGQCKCPAAAQQLLHGWTGLLSSSSRPSTLTCPTGPEHPVAPICNMCKQVMQHGDKEVMPCQAA